MKKLLLLLITVLTFSCSKSEIQEQVEVDLQIGVNSKAGDSFCECDSEGENCILYTWNPSSDDYDAKPVMACPSDDQNKMVNLKDLTINNKAFGCGESHTNPCDTDHCFLGWTSPNDCYSTQGMFAYLSCPASKKECVNT